MPELPDPDERRKRYFEDYADRVGRHREGEHFYEQRAIDFASNALKALTYLNGGGLIAVPAAIGLFHADPSAVKLQILCSALAFVAGLFCVAASQGCAFCVMARRSEAEQYLQIEQTELLNATHYPGDQKQQAENLARAEQQRNTYIEKRKRSDHWRIASLIFVCASLVLFVIGCAAGAWLVLKAG
jgi:hypothetical protein